MIFNLGGGAFETPTLNPSYPADASVSCIDGQSASATFNVEIATHGAPTEYTYQWYEGEEAISGATSASYTKTVTAGGTHTLYCTVTNAAGTVQSRTATLTVTLHKTPVLNTSYPADVTQVEKSGGSASFSVEIATHGAPTEYTYQWYVNGSAVSGATSSSYTKTGLTSTATYTVYCTVTNAAGTVQSRTATLTVQSSQPAYTYSGSHELIKEGTYNWKIKLKTSGTLRFSRLGNCTGTIDVFLVGGGAGGSERHSTRIGGGGGGSGKTATFSTTITTGADYVVSIGGGGSANGGGGSTTAFGKTANGGSAPSSASYLTGGSGGSGGGTSNTDLQTPGAGGSDGSNGGKGYSSTAGGTGQHTTTREFGESGGTLYAGGGGSGSGRQSGTTHGPAGAGGSGGGGRGSGTAGNAQSGATNTGGGGGGAAPGIGAIGSGGSGIVVIRNHR